MKQELPTKSGIPKTAKKIILGIIILIIFIPILWFSSLFVITCIAASKTLHEADEGFKKAKATINPEQLRAWALEEISKKQSTNTNPPDSEIPTYIQNLYADPPEDFVVDANTVTIYWGGGFFHWVIDVGNTNYTETTGIVENHFTTVEWVPGIYYSREDTRHPFK